jgi:2-succinyl-5-enolpyruvyl-6-hydroxy-3-cyclohexene-1-carboxylate synthase
MLTEYTSLNALWASLIVEELIRNRVDYFCLSPGSRNSPLTVSIACNEKALSIVHYDERGTAFHALGYARATRRPAVLVSTSGTATADFMPAVIEASMAMVPLIVLTADRPPELRNTGANQTIDQVKLFGGYVRWFCDLPCSDADIKPEFVLTTVDQAVYRATRPPTGPVHINCMFREPLAPIGQKREFSLYLSDIKWWREDQKPYTEYVYVPNVLDTKTVARATTIISKADKVILVVGRLHSSEEQEAVKRVACHLNWPTFPDIASGLRLGVTSDNLIAYYEQLLLSNVFAESYQPLTVVHFGSVPTSKRLQRFMERGRIENYIMVAGHPWRHDPGHCVTMRIEADVEKFCKQLLALIEQPRAKRPWLEQFTTASDIVGRVLHKGVDDNDRLSEPAVARLISQNIRPDSGLFVANSMPIRDMDMYADPHGPVVTVACNRGASGIDGIIATATGFARGLNKPVTLLIGDLAFLHDVNSLALLRALEHPLVIVVINNNGGGLFSFLPIAEVRDVFEPFFGTPHGLSFDKAADMFGLDYFCPDSKESFLTSYISAQEENRSAIIEIKSNRAENYRFHQALQKEIISALNNL